MRTFYEPFSFAHFSPDAVLQASLGHRLSLKHVLLLRDLAQVCTLKEVKCVS
jgi:hypothetical protein